MSQPLGERNGVLRSPPAVSSKKEESLEKLVELVRSG
jgi:hypothetical protein